MKFNFAVVLLVAGVVSLTVAIPSRKFFPEQETNDGDTAKTDKDLTNRDGRAVFKRWFCNMQCSYECIDVPCKCSGFFIYKEPCKSTCRSCGRRCVCKDWNW